jgi:hypothetical protein
MLKTKRWKVENFLIKKRLGSVLLRKTLLLIFVSMIIIL